MKFLKASSVPGAIQESRKIPGTRKEKYDQRTGKEWYENDKEFFLFVGGGNRIEVSF